MDRTSDKASSTELTNMEGHHDDQGTITAKTHEVYSSTPDVCFPTPQHAPRLTDLLQKSHLIMLAPSEDAESLNTLGDSTYEMIDTDTESRDDDATESIVSVDYNGDEVRSVGDEDYSEEGSEAGNRAMSPIPFYYGLDGSTHTPTIAQSTNTVINDSKGYFSPSIEFEEPSHEDLATETVSVKHTIRNYDEEEADMLSERLKLSQPPRRLVVSICQTMTKKGLSMKEPLKILYVGSPAAKAEIMNKIGSSVHASVSGGSNTEAGEGDSQLYTVVPVSAFGSEQAPEVELLQSSGCQLSVGECKYALVFRDEVEPTKAATIKLNLGNDDYCCSVPTGSSFAVEPAWDLPHIAILYCTDNDTLDARRTRTFVKTFMSRHNVPTIVVSHRQHLDYTYGSMALDQHSIHISLESRDPVETRNPIHKRFPIDLASFLNIDARQMNRNLAFLTGLTEKDSTLSNQGKTSIRPQVETKQAGFKANSGSRNESTSYVHRTNLTKNGYLLLAILSGLFFSFVLVNMTTSLIRSRALSQVTINGNLASTEPRVVLSTTATFVESGTHSTAQSTFTSIRFLPKTTPEAHSSHTGPNSLSTIPTPENSKVSQHNLKKFVCAAEPYGNRELLIKIPSATLTSWLGKGTMMLQVKRGEVTVETERAYSTDDGIILRFPRKEAYGLMNISIITSRKPKINETFEIDFGSSWRHELEDGYERFFSFAKETTSKLQLFAQTKRQATTPLTQILFRNASSIINATQFQLDTVKQQVRSQINAIRKLEFLPKRAAVSEIKEQLSELQAKLKNDVQELNLPEKVSDALLRAQINSKLWWMRTTGTPAEHDEYARRASLFVKARRAERARADRQAKMLKRKTDRAARKANAHATSMKAKKCNGL